MQYSSEETEFLNSMKNLSFGENEKRFKAFKSVYTPVIDFFGKIKAQLDEIENSLNDYDYEILNKEWKIILDKALELYNEIDLLDDKISKNFKMQSFIQMAQEKMSSVNIDTMIRKFSETIEEIKKSLIEKDIFIDHEQGLMWQDDESVKTTSMPWEKAISYAENLKFAGYNDWRLPTIDELLSIMDDTKYNPAIKSNIKNISSDSYWSSSSYVSDSSYAWYVNFDNDICEWKDKCRSSLVRCIRDTK